MVLKWLLILIVCISIGRKYLVLVFLIRNFIRKCLIGIFGWLKMLFFLIVLCWNWLIRKGLSWRSLFRNIMLLMLFGYLFVCFLFGLLKRKSLFLKNYLIWSFCKKMFLKKFFFIMRRVCLSRLMRKVFIIKLFCKIFFLLVLIVLLNLMMWMKENVVLGVWNYMVSIVVWIIWCVMKSILKICRFFWVWWIVWYFFWMVGYLNVLMKRLIRIFILMDFLIRWLRVNNLLFLIIFFLVWMKKLI